MLATLNNCLAIFDSNHKVVLYFAMTHNAIQTRAHNDGGTPPGMKLIFIGLFQIASQSLYS